MNGETFQTDVLVIGGGVAGAFSSILAAKFGATSIIMTKGLLGKSGCATMAAFFPASDKVSPPHNTDSIAEFWVRQLGGFWLADQEVVRHTIEKGPDMIRELEKLGMYFRRAMDGSLVYSPMGGAKDGVPIPPLNTIASKAGESGRKILGVLCQEIRRRGIRVLEDTAATALLVRGGHVIGATGLDYCCGELFTVIAKATILATGPSGYLWRYSTSCRENTGDGHMLAYRAGAELESVEMQDWHISDIARPYSWRRLNVNVGALPPYYDAVLFFDDKGEPLVGGKALLQDHGATPAKLVATAIRRGHASPRGGYYASMRHMDLEQLEEYNVVPTYLRKLGIDPAKQMIECGMTAHNMLGGVKTNVMSETTLPGLYTAGTVGASMMPSLAYCLVSSFEAAKSAATKAKKIDFPMVPEDLVGAERDRVYSYFRLAPDGGYIPIQVKRRIRDIMYEYMHFFKSETTMRKCLELLQGVKGGMVPKMGLASTSRRFNYAWVEALDVVNMIDLAELVIQSSLYRTESRGPFQREDYPHMNNKEWLKRIRIKLQDGQKMIYTVPVELPYYRPS